MIYSKIISKQSLKNNLSIILLIFLLIIGLFFRLYNLNWGSPYYFHPDERNIASSVSQLKFPDQMNPHFFAYGSFPIYLIYFTGLFINVLNQIQGLIFTYQVSFSKAILISRFYSAILSIVLIPLTYFLGKRLHGNSTGLISATLSSLSIGFIQFAHFGTFEMWLAFLSFVLFYLCLQIKKYGKLSTLALASVITGLLCAVKISSLVLIPLPFISFFTYIYSRHISRKYKLVDLLPIVLKSAIPIYIIFSIFIITNPYALLDFASFKSSISYEASVALGTLPVFYTGEFFSTTPILFQFIHIYPFLLNPLLSLILIPSFIYILLLTIKSRSSSYIMLLTFFLILLLSQVFLFTKWTRYMLPTLAFMYLIISIFIEETLQLMEKKCQISSIKSIALTLIIIASAVFTFSYFKTTFVNKDVRITASDWANKHISSQSTILSEAYDMGIVPFNQYFSRITLFNFYDLDNNSTDSSWQKLQSLIAISDYIILPSQRILKTRLINNEQFPIGYMFYNNLAEEKKGFVKIYETPCDIFCKINYLNNPVFSFEETATVFDRPTVFIFKKNKF